MAKLICLSDRCTQNRLISDFKDIMIHIEDRHELMKFDDFEEEWCQIRKQIRDFRSVKELLKGSISVMKKQLDEMLYGLDERFLKIDDLSSNLELDLDKYEIKQAMHLYKQFQDLKQDKKDMNDFITLDLESYFEKFQTLYGHLYNKLGIINTIIDAMDKEKVRNQHLDMQVAQLTMADINKPQQFKMNSDSETKIEQQLQSVQQLAPGFSNTPSNGSDTNQFKQQEQVSIPKISNTIQGLKFIDAQNPLEGQNSKFNFALFTFPSEPASRSYLGKETQQFKSNSNEINGLQPLEARQLNNIFANSSNNQQEIRPFKSLQNSLATEQDIKSQNVFGSYVKQQQEQDQKIPQVIGLGPWSRGSEQTSQANNFLGLFKSQEEVQIKKQELKPFVQQEQGLFQQSSQTSNPFQLSTQSPTLMVLSDGRFNPPLLQPIQSIFTRDTSSLSNLLSIPTENTSVHRIPELRSFNQSLDQLLIIQPQQQQQQLSQIPEQERHKQEIQQQISFDTDLSEDGVIYTSTDGNANEVILRGKKFLICDQSFLMTEAFKLQLHITPQKAYTKLMIGIVCLERWKIGSIEKYRRTGETVSNRGNPYLSLIEWKEFGESGLTIKFKNKMITIDHEHRYYVGDEGFSDDDEVTFFIESQQCTLEITW